jgi:hypothetical protein
LRKHKGHRGSVLCVLCFLGVLCVIGVDATAQVSIGVEAQRDRFTYHFDNPSSVDTPFPVPHFFEQRYVADNVWLVGAARYLAGVRWETSGGITPLRTSTGDDYDTFFDPDGTVIVSGTTGGISIRSLRLSQRAELGRLGPVRLVAGYRLRIDRSDFQLGHKTVTRNGALVGATDVTTRETTSSQMHEALVGGVLARELADGWTLSLDGEAAPTAVGRLLVQLPDKYPGQDLVFLATVAAVSGRGTLARRVDRWTIEISVDAGHTWSFKSDAALTRDLLGAGVRVGRVW